jgi:hypothetical protein
MSPGSFALKSLIYIYFVINLVAHSEAHEMETGCSVSPFDSLLGSGYLIRYFNVVVSLQMMLMETNQGLSFRLGVGSIL